MNHDDRDPFDPEEEEETPGTSQNLEDVRKWGRRRDRAAKAAEKSLADEKTAREAAETKLRDLELRATAKEKGVDDAKLELLKKIKPDATAEELDSFLELVGTKPSEEGEEKTEEAEEEKEEEKGFQPVSGGGRIPPEAVTSDKLADALKKHDSKTFGRMVEEALKDPSRLQLKHGHLIED